MAKETKQAAKAVTKIFKEDKKRGEINEVRQLLHDESESKRREGIQEAIGIMSTGKDVSALVLDVLKCGNTNSLDVKKLVFIFLMLCGPTQDASMACHQLVADTTHPNPIVRAMAIRTFSSLAGANKETLNEYMDTLKKALDDQDGYVVKTALLRIIRLCKRHRAEAEAKGILGALVAKLNGGAKPVVIANCLAVLNEIDPEGKLWPLNPQKVGKILKALEDAPEWAMLHILSGVARYTPGDDAMSVCDVVSPCLNHGNSAIVLAATKVLVGTIPLLNASQKQAILAKMSPPLITLLNGPEEVQYVTLRNLNLILQSDIQIPFEIKVFFCQYNDPVYVQLEKLEIMLMLTTAQNFNEVLPELQEYAEKLDNEFVRRAVRAIGRVAIKLDSAADKCVSVLLELINGGDTNVQEEGVIVMKDIYRRYPARFEDITLAPICAKLGSFDDPEARASLIWILGEYADRIENSDNMLTSFLKSFKSEPVIVQLNILTSMVKLFLKKPSPETHKLVEETLDIATKHTDNPDVRDRGYVYWRLLASYQDQARKIVLCAKPPIGAQEVLLDASALALLLKNLATVASIYHKAPSVFVKHWDSAPLELQKDDFLTTNTSDYAGRAFQTNAAFATNMQTNAAFQTSTSYGGGAAMSAFATSSTNSAPMSAFDTNFAPSLPAHAAGDSNPFSTPFLPSNDASNPFGAPPPLPSHVDAGTPFAPTPFTPAQPQETPFGTLEAPNTANPFSAPPQPILFDGGASPSNPFATSSDSLPFNPMGSDAPVSTPFGLFSGSANLPTGTLFFPLTPEEANGIGAGLQVNGRWIYDGGSGLSLLLELTNTTPQSITGEAEIRFNNNSYVPTPTPGYQIQPDSNNRFVETIAPSTCVPINVPCLTGAASGEFPSDIIQVALKFNEIICLFNITLPLVEVLAPSGRLNPSEFGEMWKAIAGEETVDLPLSVQAGLVAPLLEQHNLFVINDGQTSLEISAKVGIDDTIILASLNLTTGKCIIKTDVPEYIVLLRNGLVSLVGQ